MIKETKAIKNRQKKKKKKKKKKKNVKREQERGTDATKPSGRG